MQMALILSLAIVLLLMLVSIVRVSSGFATLLHVSPTVFAMKQLQVTTVFAHRALADLIATQCALAIVYTVIQPHYAILVETACYWKMASVYLVALSLTP